MPTTVSQWSTTPGNNNSAPPVGAPEDMIASGVNDVLREMMAALKAEFYADATFTATVTGYASPPTGTARYVKQGNMVVVFYPAISGTSNATTATITGAPSAIFPLRTQDVWGFVTDNGTTQSGRFSVDTGGVVTLKVGYNTAFTASGTKGIPTGTIVYALN